MRNVLAQAERSAIDASVACSVIALFAALAVACGPAHRSPDVPSELHAARWVERKEESPRLAKRGSHGEWRYSHFVFRQAAGALSAEDARTGALLWSRGLYAHAVVPGGRWLAVVTTDAVEVLEMKTGETRLTVPRDPEVPGVRLAIDADVLYQVTSGTRIAVEAIAIEGGSVHWRASPVPTEFWVDALGVGNTSVFACVGSSMVLGWDKREGRRVVALGVPGCEHFEVRRGLPEEVVLSEDATTPMLVFRPEPRADSGVVVEGILKDVDGRGVGGVRVDAGLGVTHSDARGHYRVAPGLAGEVCVWAHADRLESALTCIRPRPGETRWLDLPVGAVVPGSPRYAKQRLP